jgi:DNA mismatch repair protein MutS2
MSENSLRVLEYYRLLEVLSHYAASPLGRSDCLSLKPLKELESIEAEQRLVSEMKELLQVRGFVDLSRLSDLKPILQRASKRGAFLEPKELLSVSNLIKISHSAKKWIHDSKDLCPALVNISDNIFVCHDLNREVKKSITEDGGISDKASPLIASLRSQRAALRKAIEKKLGSFLKSLKFSDDNLISVRDGRYIVSLRGDKINFTRGIVHGYSRSGSTCFIEPLTIVEENNHLIGLTEKERDEEKRILQELTKLVSDSFFELTTCLDIMGRIDGVFARAEFSKDVKGISPILCSDQVIHFLDAFNPILLSLYLESDKDRREGDAEPVIPIEVDINSKKNILIISGPNRGGKTVALKTIGLLALMSQAGMHIPVAEGSKLGIFDNILAEIGDDQDISAGLSTFSARLEHLKDIAEMATENSLVILDELGTGTDPEEGASLAMAILDYFSQKGILSAISTHYQKLKQYGLINKKAQNASVEFDHKAGRPTFKLLSGITGVSHAIGIAKDIGIKSEILEKAAQYLGKDKGSTDSIMEDLGRIMKETKAEKEAVVLARQECELSVQRLEKERERLEAEMREMLIEKEHKAENILAEAKKEFGEAIGCLKKEGSKGQSQATQRYTRAKDDLINIMEGVTELKGLDKDLSFNVGRPVFHKKLKQKGRVLGIDEDLSKIQVLIGNMRLTVGSSELVPEPETAYQKNKNKNNKRWTVSGPSPIKKELNLVGCTVAEAIPLVDRMIDQALVHGHNRLRIIHGIGSGRLKKAVREHLKENFYVKGFIPGSKEGESDGITVVEL